MLKLAYDNLNDSCFHPKAPTMCYLSAGGKNTRFPWCNSFKKSPIISQKNPPKIADKR